MASLASARACLATSLSRPLSALPTRGRASLQLRSIRRSVGTGAAQPQRKMCQPVMALPLPSDFSELHNHISLVLDTNMLSFVSAELPEGIKYTSDVSNFKLSQEAIKTFYMIFSCVFCWGAVVFGSMNDAYYDSDEYREAGGNGTQFYMYEKAEEDEENAREDLWRDELRQEIEEKMEEIKELQAGEEGEKAVV